jgi:hypothetical protein
MRHDVVDVEHLGALAEVVALEVDAGVVALERSSRCPAAVVPCAEEELADLDRCALVRGDADGLEVLVGVALGDDLDEPEARAGLDDDPDEGGGGALDVVRAVGDHDDGGVGIVADHDAGVADGARVGVNVHDDGGMVLLARPDLDVGGVGGLGGDPVRHLGAHAGLDPVEQAGEREVDVALAREPRDGEGDVVGLEVVPGLRGRRVDALERDRGLRLGVVCH